MSVRISSFLCACVYNLVFVLDLYYYTIKMLKNAVLLCGPQGRPRFYYFE
uniref:Uncharacterized protein n=1 Tax=Arundo donax TaxID=35708 RepID=A0A0A9FUL5_ARUDO